MEQTKTAIPSQAADGAVKGPVARLWTKEFLVLTACNLLVFLNLHMILSSLPLYMREHFNAGDFYVSLCTSLMALSAIVSRLFSAKALELGKRNIILFGGLAIALLGTVGYYFSASIIALLVMRVIFGFGFGMYSTTFPTMVSDIIPRNRMGEGMGYFGLSTTISMSMGPLIGMWIEKQYGFTPLVVLGSLFIMILFPLAYSLISGKHRAKESDRSQMQSKSLASTQQSAIQADSQASANPAATAASQHDSGIQAAQSTHTASEQSNMTPRKTSSFERKLLLPSLLNFLMSVTYGGLVSFIALFGSEAHIANPGYFFLFNALAVILIRPFSGKLYDRFGPKALLVPGAILLIAGLLLLSMAHSTLGLLASALCYGLGWGALQPTMQTWMIQVVNPHQRGMANGMFLNSLDLGVALGAMILGTIASATSYTSMYRYSVIFIVLYIVIGAIYMIRAKKTPAQQSPSIHIKVD
ncbi:MFS transporter [Paenibacillus hunanensis]|uniref:MFS transporter n=1 Tax=Paenibacillus hunanensis TaxID=539262 RepID=UPI002A6A21CF|nr:MFS transporter [Paenibacillus hunanensis]WPP39962.1 MFS transporter [Paenibacillus hunanensis]